MMRAYLSWTRTLQHLRWPASCNKMILGWWLFGWAFVGTQAGGDSSVAVFSVVMPHLPIWCVILLLPLGLALVMSSAGTALNAGSSLIAVDIRGLWPEATGFALTWWSRCWRCP